MATLTHADIARIAEHTRLGTRRFVVEDGLDEEEAQAYESRRPLYRGYFRRGPIRLSLASRAGACVFLDRVQGCVLPSDVRPTACQLYPFEQWADGSWSVAVGRFGNLPEAREAGGACLAVEEAEAMEGVLATFGRTREEVEALGAQLAAEARAHGLK